MFSDRTNWKLASNRLTETLERVRCSGANVLDLTVSNPTRIGLKFDQDAILNSFASSRALDYDPNPKGLLEARQAVAAYYRDDHNAVVDPEHIFLTTSTSEGYSYVFRLLCNPGDELLVPKPSYPLFEFLADLQDVKLVPYPLIYDHGWQMDFPSLRRALTKRTRGVVVVHPNNPTGSYVHSGELPSLNAFCREHGLALIVDEVFLDYGLQRGSTTFAANHDVLTFTLSGLSKISALPQMKVSWIVITGSAPDLQAAMPRMEMISDTYLSMNAPVQWGIARLLAQRKMIQTQLMQRVGENLATLDRLLATQQACRRLVVEAGWYAVLRAPVTQTDEELAVGILEKTNVLVHPGHFYDFPSDGYLILSLIASPGEFQEGTTRLLRYIAQS
ncbi:MAG TPA: pyridoxal phosphate-dependent aminotransferase [Candidatus Sulfotelmatobacter sp.]|nr:pyridoxal phosphate-dependent aminotransferase [Candidatus Sulfotelmatobacter sp.]